MRPPSSMRGWGFGGSKRNSVKINSLRLLNCNESTAITGKPGERLSFSPDFPVILLIYLICRSHLPLCHSADKDT